MGTKWLYFSNSYYSSWNHHDWYWNNKSNN